MSKQVYNVQCTLQQSAAPKSGVASYSHTYIHTSSHYWFQLSSTHQDMATQTKNGSQQKCKCKLCRLTGDFQCTESAKFKDLVTIPGVSVLGLKNKKPQTPSDAEQVMKEVIDEDWKFSSHHLMDMTAVTKDPQKKSYLDETIFLDEIR